MSINNSKPNGFSKLYKNKNIEKCVFCQEEYFRETLWEGVGQEKPEIFQISICKKCHACFKDARVMKEIREVIEKSSSKLNEGGEKVEYFCGMYQLKIYKNYYTIICVIFRYSGIKRVPNCLVFSLRPILFKPTRLIATQGHEEDLNSTSSLDNHIYVGEVNEYHCWFS